MKPRSANPFFVIVLCVLALFVAQTFGKRADYLCVCGGTPVPTVASHCYGPHGQNCSDKEAQESSPSHAEHDQDNHQGDRKEHQVVSKELTSSRPADAAAQIVAPPVLLAVLPVLCELVEDKGVEVAPSYFLACEQSPSFGVTMARTVVLLI